MQPLSYLWLVMCLLSVLAGCAGSRSFTTAARAGETVALAVGWQNLARQNLSVTITPATGAPITYAPNDPRVKAIINLYPDPSSGLVVGSQTNQNFGNDDSTLGQNINSFITQGDREWWQTTILLDLPATIAVGTAVVSLNDSQGAILRPVNIEVLPGSATSNPLNVFYPWANSNSHDLLATYPGALKALEPSARYKVLFSSYLDSNGREVVPHSIQAEFSHTPGVGKPWVINPRGDIKNIIWNDDGTILKVLLTPVRGRTLGLLLQQKFYIAGGLTGLALTSLKAYDINGNLMSGISASVQ